LKIKRVAEKIRNPLSLNFGLAYAINACAIPKIDAIISTHFQQYVLFIFLFLVVQRYCTIYL